MTDDKKSETEFAFEEKILEALSREIGIIPPQIEALGALLKTTRNMIRYYFGDSGIHFNDDTAATIENLTLKSDYLVLSFNRLQYQAKEFETDATKKILAKQKYTADKKEASRFLEQFEKTKAEIQRISQTAEELLNEFGKTQRR